MSMEKSKALLIKKIMILSTGCVEYCKCPECSNTSIDLKAFKFKGTDDFFFRIEEVSESGWRKGIRFLYYRNTGVKRMYHAGYSIGLEDVLESAPPDIQTNILFHLDLFR